MNLQHAQIRFCGARCLANMLFMPWSNWLRLLLARPPFLDWVAMLIPWFFSVPFGEWPLGTESRYHCNTSTQPPNAPIVWYKQDTVTRYLTFPESSFVSVYYFGLRVLVFITPRENRVIIDHLDPKLFRGRTMPKDRKPLKQTDIEGLVVTAQQSRFHVDASDKPASKEVCCTPRLSSKSQCSHAPHELDRC